MFTKKGRVGNLGLGCFQKGYFFPGGFFFWALPGRELFFDRVSFALAFRSGGGGDFTGSGGSVAGMFPSPEKMSNPTKATLR